MTPLTFVHDAPAVRVVFASGALAQLGEEAARLGLERVLVISTPEQTAQAEMAAAALGGRLAGIFAGAAMHTPVEVTQEALAVAGGLGADGLAAIGGGSAVGLAKAIALRTDLPQIAVPTTYAGSEATSILGQTEGGLKTTLRSPKVQPEVILYDVELTLTLPVAMSVTSGLNAIAHAAEALYAVDRSPLVEAMAEDAVRALGAALPQIAERPQDLAARSQALYGAWLCGVCLNAVSMGLHHKLCHTLGGAFDLPHAATHTVILPHALAYNLPYARTAAERLSRALGGQDPAQALDQLARALKAPRALRDLGMPEDGLDRAADLAVQNAYANPRPIERPAIRAMLQRAWAGEPPEAWGFASERLGAE